MRGSIENGNGDQDGISSSEAEIWQRWKERKPPRHVAEETGAAIETTYRTLAHMQKGLMERIGYGRQQSRQGGTRVATS